MITRNSHMDDYEYIDPYEVAARTTMLLSEKDEIPLNDALVLFMQSDTFLNLISKKDFRRMEPNEILSLYRSETYEHV